MAGCIPEENISDTSRLAEYPNKNLQNCLSIFVDN